MTAMLEMRGVSKSFAGVQALRDVSFTVEAGQIHALVGENGAGKSTLMKVLSGVYPAGSYDGSIVFDGEERRFRDINDSEALGIIIIHQELALIPLMSIAENIFLSHPPSRFGVIDRNAVHRRTAELLAQVGLREPPDTLITDLGVGKQQLVEIAKALSKRVRLLILDEPTASLNEADSAALLERLLAFREQGIASILISHKLNEVARVADRITVLRDGRTIDSIDCRTERIEEDRIIRSMVDRDLAHRFPERKAEIGEPVMTVENWSVYHPLHTERQVIKNVDFTLRRGEVVGIAGLMGAGRTEFAMSLFGRAWGTNVSGKVRLDGREADLSSVPAAIDAGIAYVTEDRKQLGLILAADVRKNVTVASLRQVSDRGRDRRCRRAEGRERLPHPDADPLLRRLPGDRRPLGRQPAEGRAVEMADDRSEGAAAGRADARDRRRGEIRDLLHHQRAGGGRQGRRGDLLGDARAARHLRPDLRDE
ncbi:putative multiple sugar transport system ATP-binding protein [Bradyrhizobium sp. USDA 4512]